MIHPPSKKDLTDHRQWGIAFALGSGLGYLSSPLYRSLTVQFKTYIQMSGMILGGYLEADKRFQVYQLQMRHERRLARDMAVWRRYEREYEEHGTPGVAGEGRVGRDDVGKK